MANFTAADIKALREQTAAGMMDVKRALEEADGDMAQAAEILRIKGLKGVTKREGRSASNGLVAAKVSNGVGTLVEVNCETDFVAKGERFIALADQVLALTTRHGMTSFGEVGDAFDPALHEALMQQPLPGATQTCVSQVIQPGHRIDDKVLRPARVAVSDPDPEATTHDDLTGQEDR